jgi:two-component system response regulator FixJ
MECLVFADGDERTAETLASVLGDEGIRVTRPLELDECLDLLARHCWECLVLAGGETRAMFDALSQCRRIYPEVPVLVLVRHGDIETAVRAMKAGAADCVEMPVETARLLSVVTDLCCQAVREPPAYRAQLTRMERTVLGHILEGHTNREIADAICRSPRTIEVHRRHIMKKLGATNLVELLKQTLYAGDVSGTEACHLHAEEC